MTSLLLKLLSENFILCILNRKIYYFAEVFTFCGSHRLICIEVQDNTTSGEQFPLVNVMDREMAKKKTSINFSFGFYVYI